MADVAARGGFGLSGACPRRAFVRLGCVAATALCTSRLLGGRAVGAADAVAQGTEAGGDFAECGSRARIMLATDVHYLSPSLTDGGAYFQALLASSDGKVTMYVDELVDAFAEVVVREDPDALVIAGDLTYNGERQSHLDFASKLRTIARAGIPVLVIPGNHDIACPMAARFEGDGYEFVESVTAREFAEIYGEFGYGGALARDTDSLSYVWELAPALRLLFVDVNGTRTPGEVSSSTAAWVEGQLADAAGVGARVVAVSHQSLLAHTFVTDGYVAGGAARLLDLYKRHGVAANLCGHYHIQHITVDDDGFTEMATSSLSVSPNQYALVEIAPQDSDESGDRCPGEQDGGPQWGSAAWAAGPLRFGYRTERLDAEVSRWAAARGSDDPNLLDFEAYARDFFSHGDDARNTLILQLALSGFEEAVAMCDFLNETNYAYLSGTLDGVEPRPDLVELWEQADVATGYYLRSIYEFEPAANHNEISFDLP